jgi:septal ring factor EnvC (AmiA/AmiB activator)
VQGLGVALPGSDLDAALKEMREDPMYPLVKKAREERSAAWLTYVGYDNNGKAVKTDSVAAVEKDVADLQAQIDAMRRK